MKIVLAQTNPRVGDFAGNLRAMTRTLDQCRERGLVVFPELSLCGAPPEDLVERPAFLAAHDRALEALLAHTRRHPYLVCVVGGLERVSGTATSVRPGLWNAAFVLADGAIIARARKRRLNDQDTAHESRHFLPGESATARFSVDGLRCALTIGADIASFEQPNADEPPDLLLNIRAEPFHPGIDGERRALAAEISRARALPLALVQQAGGQGDLVFDGRSFLMDKDGALLAQAAAFREDLVTLDFPAGPAGAPPAEEEDGAAERAEALCRGIRDYFGKNGFGQAILGLSGGIDSALVAALACRALGPDKVLGVALPSPYTSDLSLNDARRLAENLGCEFKTIPIQPAMSVFQEMLAPHFQGLPEDTTEQNIQARIRGMILMALANKRRGLVLATGNKSELAVGYCTLHGDMCGGLAPLADVTKTQVYALSRRLNRDREIIPETTIARPPTAELKPGQLDQDDLPPYELLDQILVATVEEALPPEAIAARLSTDIALVRDVVRRIRVNEHKRKQAAPGIRVSRRAFGGGRRMPVINGFAEEAQPDAYDIA